MRGIPPHHVAVLLVYIDIKYNYCRRTLYTHSRVPSPLSPSLSGCVGEVVVVSPCEAHPDYTKYARLMLGDVHGPALFPDIT